MACNKMVMENKKMKYVDGFVLVVPEGKCEEYKKMAESGRDMWMKFGALEYCECRGNDLVPQGMDGCKTRAFTEMAGSKSDETVWFSFIVFESKEHRDDVNAKVIEEMGRQMRGVRKYRCRSTCSAWPTAVFKSKWRGRGLGMR